MKKITTYFDSGDVESEYFERGGLICGDFHSWHENGRQFCAATYENGKMHGVLTEWSEEGVMSLQMDVADGLAHGEFRSWWSNGTLKEVGRYVRGERQKGYKWFAQDGSLVQEFKRLYG